MPKSMPTQDQQVFSYCESIGAGSKSRWCIRPLSPAGPKYSGGVDTSSLCGHVTRGWDINVAISDDNLDGACPVCASLYCQARTQSPT